MNEATSKILDRGQRYFETVYGKVSERVMGRMDSSGSEDLGLTARLMYGYILSNTSVLNSAETSYVMIAGLIPMDVSQITLDVDRTLISEVGESTVEGPPEGSTQQRSDGRRGQSCARGCHQNL
jgi:hypothetical protein